MQFRPDIIYAAKGLQHLLNEFVSICEQPDECFNINLDAVMWLVVSFCWLKNKGLIEKE